MKTDPMSEAQRTFLEMFGQLPARLNYEQTAWLLNFKQHDIPVLVKHGQLKPIGNPPVTGVKYFAAVEIVQIMKDRTWLSRATNIIHRHWAEKNLGKGRYDSDDGAVGEG